ncbi:MAG: CDP-diacylglycerol--glycerol-3-phosphate 3-phosphatidyltransferase [Blastochloris sp.]|nr:CDP-diacylglycerol--glycerol-3-phosphate 3-phosphatidyltransferase [Blastochloris sp.]
MLFSLRSLPNLLGILRIIATPLLVWLILLTDPGAYLWAVVLLIAMALSDMADGKIARRLKVVSPLGIFLDTISDKIFVAGALLPLVQIDLLSSWVAFVIIVREFIVSGLRSYAAAEGQVISAGKWGKQKLVIQVVAIIWLLLAANVAAGGILGIWFDGGLRVVFDLWPIAMGLAVIWTIGSGLEYIWHAWPLLRDSWNPRSTAN